MRVFLVIVLFLIAGLSHGQKRDTLVARVHVTFNVTGEGKTTKIEVVKMKCKKCSEGMKDTLRNEAIKVVKELPERTVKSLPPQRGQTQGETRYRLPFKFKIAL